MKNFLPNRTTLAAFYSKHRNLIYIIFTPLFVSILPLVANNKVTNVPLFINDIPKTNSWNFIYRLSKKVYDTRRVSIKRFLI